MLPAHKGVGGGATALPRGYDDADHYGIRWKLLTMAVTEVVIYLITSRDTCIIFGMDGYIQRVSSLCIYIYIITQKPDVFIGPLIQAESTITIGQQARAQEMPVQTMQRFLIAASVQLRLLYSGV